MCRKQLVPNMPESAAEGLLYDPDGHLLEGFVTNLFIVAGTDLSMEQNVIVVCNAL